MTIFTGKLTAVSIVAMAIFSTHATADDDINYIETVSKQFGLISMEEAKIKALAVKPGVIKDADLENRKFGKGWDYEFEIIDADGKEWEVNIDAKTGKVSSVHRDWF